DVLSPASSLTTSPKATAARVDSGCRRNRQTPDDSRTRKERIQYALHFRKIAEPHEIARAIKADQVTHPGENGDVGDAVLLAHDPVTARQALIQHAKQAPGFGGVAIARTLVFIVLARKFVEEPDLSEHRPDATHLEHHPLQRFVTACSILRHELAGLFCQVNQNG